VEVPFRFFGEEDGLRFRDGSRRSRTISDLVSVRKSFLDESWQPYSMGI
jgi:hypothetical protein